MSKDKNEVVKSEKKFDLTKVISGAIKLPGVKVVRETFLREQFKNLSKDEIELIVEKGPVNAGRDRNELEKKAKKIIKSNSGVSAAASFVAGLPGGFAMAATIPADLLQFYGVALRTAQELVYLYGEEDMWCEGTPDPDKVTNQLILYCGVMFGATGASEVVRVMSASLAKEALKKIPRKALMKTAYYPVLKSVLKFFGVNVTKSTFAKGLSKVIPVVGGVISGGLTLASMIPMGNRLFKTLDKAHFDYSKADFEEDMKDINAIYVSQQNGENDPEIQEITASIDQQIIENDCVIVETPVEKSRNDDINNDTFSKIEKAKKMLEEGIITEDEFIAIKGRIISEM